MGRPRAAALSDSVGESGGVRFCHLSRWHKADRRGSRRTSTISPARQLLGKTERASQGGTSCQNCAAVSRLSRNLARVFRFHSVDTGRITLPQADANRNEAQSRRLRQAAENADLRRVAKGRYLGGQPGTLRGNECMTFPGQSILRLPASFVRKRGTLDRRMWCVTCSVTSLLPRPGILAQTDEGRILRKSDCRCNYFSGVIIYVSARLAVA